jgi:aryl-alcohol dehydrogenase (NADP+)
MNYRTLGRSDLLVSEIALGSWLTYGGGVGRVEAEACLAAALDAGINFIDTADVYCKGESEKIVGKLIAQDRSRWVLATKLANAMGDDPNRRGTGRKWMMQAIDESLARLGTDYVDLYYIHKDPADVPMEETVRAMGELIAAGKVRYWGVSNLRGWRIAQAVEACRALGVPQPVASQPYYNLLNRQPENEILPACAHYGLGVVPYSPIARGVLAGKYKPGEAPPQGTRAARNDKRMMETEFRAESLVIAQKLKAHAEKKGITAGDFAVNWVLANPIVTSVIAGPRTFDQWAMYLAALGKPFDAEDEALVDSMVSPGHPSTPGYNDPAYPLTGRPVARR